MKQCTVCLEIKPLDNFHKLSKARSHLGDGHATQCKSCVRERSQSPRAKAMARDAWKRRYATPEGKKKEQEKYRRYRQTENGKISHRNCNKKYRQTDKGKIACRQKCSRFRQTEAFKEAIARHRAKYPERRAANVAVKNALHSGKLFRPNHCLACGIKCIPHGHHPDYSKPLEVVWLCHKCHVDFHWGRMNP